MRLVVPAGFSDQEGPVAVEQAVGLDELVALSSRGTGKVGAFNHPAGQDRLAQQRQLFAVDGLARTGTHGQALGLQQNAEIGLETLQRSFALCCAQLCFDIPKPGCVLREPGLFESLGGCSERSEFLCRDRHEASQGVRLQPPVFPAVVDQDNFKRTERPVGSRTIPS